MQFIRQVFNLLRNNSLHKRNLSSYLFVSVGMQHSLRNYLVFRVLKVLNVPAPNNRY